MKKKRKKKEKKDREWEEGKGGREEGKKGRREDRSGKEGRRKFGFPGVCFYHVRLMKSQEDLAWHSLRNVHLFSNGSGTEGSTAGSCGPPGLPSCPSGIVPSVAHPLGPIDVSR